jgi:hypothetical protein
MPPAIIAAAIGGATAIGGALISNSAQNKANKAQATAAQQQLDAQQAARTQITQLQQPAIDARNVALQAILDRYNLGGQTATPQTAPAAPARTSVVGDAGFGGNGGKPAGGVSANYGTPQGGVSPNSSGNGRAFGGGMGDDTGGAAPAQPGQAQPNAAPTIDTEAFLKANPDVAAYYNQTPEAQQESLEAFAGRVATEQADVRGPPPMTQAPAQPSAAAPAPYVPEYTRPDQGKWQDSGPAPSQADFLDPSKFTTSPGYEFRLNEGTRNLNARYGAGGLLKSGSALKGVTDYSQGAASAEYGNWFNQQNTLYQEALGQYNQDRSANYNIFTGERNNTNQNFADDRSYGTNLGLTNRTYDTAQATDARNNSQSQDQQRLSNLFGLVNNGTSAAASVGGAATNFANNATDIYGNQANNSANAAYANGATGAQLLGNLGGTAANLFAGTARVPASNTTGQVNMGSLNYGNIYGSRPSVGVF